MESMLNSKNGKKILYFVPNLLKDGLNAFQLASSGIPNNKFLQYRYNSRDQVQEETKFVSSLLLLERY